MKSFKEFLQESVEIHVNDGSDEDFGPPSKSQRKEISKILAKNRGKFSGSSDKGFYAEFPSKYDAQNFRNAVKKSSVKSIYWPEDIGNNNYLNEGSVLAMMNGPYGKALMDFLAMKDSGKMPEHIYNKIKSNLALANKGEDDREAMMRAMPKQPQLKKVFKDTLTKHGIHF